MNKLSQEWVSKENVLEANYYVAKSFYHLNQKDEAKKLLMKVIDQKNKHSMAHQLLSKIYQDEGNQVESEYHANLFMELDSEIQEFNKN